MRSTGLGPGLGACNTAQVVSFRRAFQCSSAGLGICASCGDAIFPLGCRDANEEYDTWLFSPKLVTATFLPSIPFRIEVPSADVVGGPLAGSRRVRPAAEAWPNRHREARMQAMRSMTSGVRNYWRQGLTQTEGCVSGENDLSVVVSL